MRHIPSRDITGKCQGECRDLVKESEMKCQKKIDLHAYSGNSTQSVPWAKSRSEQPGFFGGHV